MTKNLEDITYEDMRYCVRREVQRMRRVYKGMVARDEMAKEDADWKIACMQAVQDVIEKLAAKQLVLL